MVPVFSWLDHLSSCYTSGVLARVVVAGVGIFVTYKAFFPPPPKLAGSSNGPPVTAPRVKLKDGRHIAYREFGVPRSIAHYKIIFVHGFNGGRNAVTELAGRKGFLEEHSIYGVSFDRAGYGQSDPNYLRNVKSEAEDIAELADLLELGNTFYLLSESIGGYSAWSCIKYIPHRLAGVGMMVPVVNYWWKCIDKESFNQAFGTQILIDRLFMRVVRYFPQFIYFWITQPWIPKPTPMVLNLHALNQTDRDVVLKTIQNITPEKLAEFAEKTQQGVAESLCQDVRVMFGEWEFDPCDVKDPFTERPGQVHIWQGEEDYLVPKQLQRVIHERQPWIQYHELKGLGHLVKSQEGFLESLLRTLLFGESFKFKVSV